MKWRVTARREFDRYIGSRGSTLFGMALTLVGLIGLVSPRDAVIDIAGPRVTFTALQFASHWVLPAVVLVGYGAISKERESGTYSFTVGVPQSRWAALTGIYLGRLAVFTVVTLVSFVLVALIGSIQYGLIPIIPFLTFCIMAIVFLAANLAFAVGLSSFMNRSPQAAALSLIYLFVSIFWMRLIAVPLYSVASGADINPWAPPADPALFMLQRMLPIGAFHVASNWILGAGNAATGFESVIQDIHGETTNAYRVGEAFGTDIPVYLHPVSGLLILAIWISVMIAIGHFGFTRRDLTSTGKSGSQLRWLEKVLQPPVGSVINLRLGFSSKSWYVTAHREYSRLVRRSGVFIYSGLLIVIGIFYLNLPTSVSSVLGSATTLGALQRASAIVILPTALIFGYRSLSNERESGSVAFTAGVPQSRRAILFGIISGRFVVLAIGTLIAYLFIATIGSWLYGLVPIDDFLLICLTGLLYLAANLTIGVGVSALAVNNRASATVSFVYFVLFGYFWVTLISPFIYQLISGTTVNPADTPEIPELFLLQRISPYGAYNVTTNWILGIGNSAAEFSSVALSNRFAFLVGETFGNEFPVYLEPVFGPIILLLWCAVMGMMGYIQYQNTDLV